MKSQILKMKKSLEFGKKTVKSKVSRLQSRGAINELNSKKKGENRRRKLCSNVNLNKKSVDNNCHKNSILNFKPVKSFEECEKSSIPVIDEFDEINDDSLNEMGDIKFSDENCNLDLEKVNNIKKWVASTAECTFNVSDNEEDKDIKYFDENFREIEPNSPLSESESCSERQDVVDSDEWSRKVTKITINDRNQSAMIIINSSSSEDYRSTSSGKSVSNSEDDNNNDNLISDVLVRCVEEDGNSINIRELKFCSCSNTFIMSKPLRCPKRPIKKSGDQVCNKLMTKIKQKEKQSESECHFSDLNKFKFLYLSNMSSDTEVVSPEVTYDRIIDWINLSDFKERDGISDMDTDLLERLTDITSVTRNIVRDDSLKQTIEPLKPKDIKVEERTEEVKRTTDRIKSHEISSSSMDSISKLMEKLKSNNLPSFSKLTSWKRPSSKITMSEPPLRFSAITESEETVGSLTVSFLLYTVLVPFLSLSLYYFNFVVAILFCPY